MRARIAAALIPVLGILLAARAAQALPEEPRIEGGDPSVHGSFLRPYTNKWKFSMQKPGANPVEAGVWTDTMEAVIHEGRPALKRTQVAQYKKGIRLTFVNVFDPKTMASLTFDYSRSDTGERRHLEFRDRSAHFRREPGTSDQPAQEYTAKLDHGVLDYYDGLYGILLDTLPLKEGFSAKIPAFDTDRASVDWIQVRVTGRESLAGPAGQSFDAWVVHVETKLYDSSTWWLTREPPYVLKAVLVTPESEGGVTITYTMI